MSMKQILIAVGALCVLVMAIAAFALFRTPAGASEPIQAIALTGEESLAVTEPAEVAAPVETTETSVAETPAKESPTEAPVVDTVDATATATDPAAVSVLFEIDPNADDGRRFSRPGD
jgi:hypothetical protein